MPKVQPGNPQWCDWLERLKDQAEEQGIQAAKTYNKALKSMRSCPVIFQHPKQLLELQGVGPKIIAFITKELQKECDRTNQPMPEEPAPAPRGYAKGSNAAPPKKRKREDIFDVTDEEEHRRAVARAKALGLPVPPPRGAQPQGSALRDSGQVRDAPAQPPAKKAAAGKAPKAYVPKHRSGIWGILIALYNECTYDDREVWVTKGDIQAKAQPYCDSSYDVPAQRTAGGGFENGTGFVYSAWSNMATAENKGLVITDNKRPKRWCLTEEGYTLAEQLVRKENLPTHQPSSEASGPVRRPFPMFESGNAQQHRAPSPPAPRAGPSRDLLAPQSEEEEERQLRLAIEASTKEAERAQQSRSLAASSSSSRPIDVAPPARKQLPQPRAGASTLLFSDSSDGASAPARKASGPMLDAARAAKGFYANRPVVESERPKDLGQDTPFGYFYLDPDDNRVMSRDEAEQCQEEGTARTAYRIEFRTSQDLHPMVRSVMKKAPMVRMHALPGPDTFEGFLRGRVSNSVAPGFIDKKDGAAKKASNDPFQSLLERGDYARPDKGKKPSMYAAPSSIRRLGADGFSNGPSALSSDSDLGSRAHVPAAPNVSVTAPSRSISAPAIPSSDGPAPQAKRIIPTSRTTGIPSAGETEALARARSAVLPATSTSEPLAISYDFTPNQPLVQRHPLDAVADHVSRIQCDFSSFKGAQLRAGTFKVVLIVDTRERVAHKSDPAEIINKLERLGVLVDRKMLPLGDMLWVARPYGPHGMPTGQEDIVLDAIVERKRLDDLCTSIKDGRYVSQKVRMKDSGITDRVYLIEKFQSEQIYERFGQQIWTCKSQLQVIDNFFVYEASNPSEVIEFLRLRTQVMCEMYEKENLDFIPNRFIDRRTFLALQRHLRTTQPTRKYLTTYSSFDELNKMDAATTLTLRWGRMIQAVSGVSAEKAVAFVERWPTPRSFWDDTAAHREWCEAELAANPYAAAKDKPKPEEYIANELKTGSDRDIKKALSTKIWKVWTDDKYK